MYALLAGLHGRRAVAYRSILGEEGVEGVEAEGVAEIVAQRGQPALVVVELVAADALRTTLAIHALVPEAPVVAVSAFTSLRDTAWARREALGIAAILPAEADDDTIRLAIRPLCRPPEPVPLSLFAPGTRVTLATASEPLPALRNLAEQLASEFGSASAIVEVSVAGRSVVACFGLPESDVHLAALVGGAAIRIDDLRADPAATQEPLVRAGVVRCLAGAPLTNAQGERLGSFALFDRKPIEASTEALAAVATHLVGQLDAAARDIWPEMESHRMRREIAELQEQQREAGFALSTFDKLVDHLDVGVLLFDGRGRVRIANQTLAAMLGVERQQLARATRQSLPGPEALRAVRRTTQGTDAIGEIGVLSPRRVLLWNTRPVDLPDGPGQLDTFTDITAQVDLRVMQEHLALTDALTDLANRRGGEAAIRREVARARRENIPLAFVMFDVDHFKQVNDGFGHAKGDEVLRGIARTLQAQLRASDLAVRWGGEELVAVLPAVRLAGARIVAERVRAAVEQREFGEVGQVTISAGASELQPGEDAAAALARADACLYEAKAAGRNCVR